MNRIVLIGNGFDLAHGLPTSYKDFMDSYWSDFVEKAFEDIFTPYEDDFTKLEKISGPNSAYEAQLTSTYGTGSGYNYIYILQTFFEEINKDKSYKNIKSLIGELNEVSDLKLNLSFKNKFFEHISESTCLNTWLDIENEYYCLLKSHIKTKNRNEQVRKLNDEFNQVKILLEDYLVEVCKRDVDAYQSIKNAIAQPRVKRHEIANSKREILIREKYESWIRDDYSEESVKKYVKGHHGHLNNIKSLRTLFLNFNYTSTANKLYAQPYGIIINIHGELNNKGNPIIFGYGDELDDDHKTIVNLNDNNCLDNIKSINYLRTNNYRRLLDFISMEPYQILIMGHSCGNSDRTLLNTLFEHSNCVSIKPYYHKKEDGTDNYIEIVQNVYRNFTNMALMRDIVVNKDYCEPMCQNEQNDIVGRNPIRKSFFKRMSGCFRIKKV